MKQTVGPDDQSQGEGGYDNFADKAHDEGTQALLAHFTEVGAQANSGKGEKERPAREIGESRVLILGKEADRGENRDKKKAEDELREFLPKERGFVGNGLGLSARGPIDGIGEDNEANQSVTRGLDEDRELRGRVGKKRSGGGGFGGVVDSKAGPLVAMMALTPQTADPTARSVVSFGRRPKRRPRNVMKASEPAISMNTSRRLTPPSFATSPSRNREPSSTIPALSQNS